MEVAWWRSVWKEETSGSSVWHQVGLNQSHRHIRIVQKAPIGLNVTLKRKVYRQVEKTFLIPASFCSTDSGNEKMLYFLIKKSTIYLLSMVYF
jgi:hypothetical protein